MASDNDRAIPKIPGQQPETRPLPKRTRLQRCHPSLGNLNLPHRRRPSDDN